MAQVKPFNLGNTLNDRSFAADFQQFLQQWVEDEEIDSVWSPESLLVDNGWDSSDVEIDGDKFETEDCRVVGHGSGLSKEDTGREKYGIRSCCSAVVNDVIDTFLDELFKLLRVITISSGCND